MKRSPSAVGNAGLYYVCYRLSMHGWNAMPTSRNAKGIDVVAYSRDGKRFIGLQVKSLSKRNAVPLGESLKTVVSDFWVIVQGVENPVVYIMTPEEVREMAQRAQKGESVSYWLEVSSYEKEEFREAWDRIRERLGE